MWKVSGLIEYADSQRFDPRYRPSGHHQGAQGRRFIGANDDQVEFSRIRKSGAACFYPCVLMHGAAGLLRKESPALRLVFDGAEFLDNPYG